MCHCTEYKLSALQVRISEENKLNATTQQFITAKISDCVLKQWRKTLINASEQFQLQSEAALISCRIRAVEHRKCAAGLADAHPSVKRNSYSHFASQSREIKFGYYFFDVCCVR